MQMSDNLHFSATGLAFTTQELLSLEASGYEFTGWYNSHRQPVVRNRKTGEELAYCRVGYRVADTCNVHIVYSQEARG